MKDSLEDPVLSHILETAQWPFLRCSFSSCTFSWSHQPAHDYHPNLTMAIPNSTFPQILNKAKQDFAPLRLRVGWRAATPAPRCDLQLPSPSCRRLRAGPGGSSEDLRAALWGHTGLHLRGLRRWTVLWAPGSACPPLTPPLLRTRLRVKLEESSGVSCG